MTIPQNRVGLPIVALLHCLAVVGMNEKTSPWFLWRGFSLKCEAVFHETILAKAVCRHKQLHRAYVPRVEYTCTVLVVAVAAEATPHHLTVSVASQIRSRFHLGCHNNIQGQ